MFLRRSDVPAYLQRSEFFFSLDSDDDDCFEVPSGSFKADLTEISLKKLPLILNTVRFWVLTEMPVEIFRFLDSLTDHEWVECRKIIVDYPEYQEYFRKNDCLRITSPKDKIPMAIQLQLGVQVLKYLHEEGRCTPAEENNHLGRLKYFCESSNSWHPATIEACIVSNSFDCFEYAVANGCPIRDNHINEAASCGNVPFMKRLLPHVRLKAYRVTADAAAYGHIDCLRFAHENGFPLGLPTCYAAVETGHLDCLQYALENGCECPLRVMDSAAGNGRLNCLVYLRQRGIHPWNAFTCACAASGGHLDCLEYLHRQGCAWDIDTVKYAMREGHWDCVLYALRYNCPCDDLMLSMCSMYCLDGIFGMFGAKAAFHSFLRRLN